MSSFDFDSLLDDGVAHLQTGRSASSFLAQQPQHAAELQPLLALAQRAQAAPAPRARPQAVRAGRQRLLAAVAQEFPAPPVSSRPFTRYAERLLSRLSIRKGPAMGLVLRAAYAFVSICALAGIFTVTAAAESLPGDDLYTVKRAWEGVELLLSFGPQARADYEARLALERRREVSALMGQHRSARGVEFTAMIQAIEADDWLISALPMKVTTQTQVQGWPAVGDFIHVIADVEKGDLLARRVLLPSKPVPVPCSDTALCATKTPSPTPAPTRTLLPTRTAIATGCNDVVHCPTRTATPCTTAASVKCPTPSRTPCSNAANCHPSRTPTVTASPQPSPTPCPAAVCVSPTPAPCLSNVNCPTATPLPSRTPCAGSVNCLTPTATHTRVPCTNPAGTPNCLTPTRTSTPAGCNDTTQCTPTPCSDAVKCATVTPPPAYTATATPCPNSDCAPTATPCSTSTECGTRPPTWTWTPPPATTVDPCAGNVNCVTPLPSRTPGTVIPKP